MEPEWGDQMITRRPELPLKTLLELVFIRRVLHFQSVECSTWQHGIPEVGTVIVRRRTPDISQALTPMIMIMATRKPYMIYINIYIYKSI